MKYILGFIVSVSFLLITPSFVYATDYYVSTTGSDTNSGTSTSSAFKTIQTAANKAVAGDTVQIMTGTYYQKFAPANSGTSTAYITYMPYSGANVIIDGTGVSLSSTGYKEGLIQISGKSYIKIQGLTVNKSSVDGVNILPAPDGTKSHHIEITGMNVNNSTHEGIISRNAQYITVKNNKINYVYYSSGIAFWSCDQILADNNVIVNAHVSSQANGGHEESLSVASTTNFEISNNDISMNGYTGYLGNEGLDIKEASRYGKVHHNYVHDYSGEGGGLYVDAWKSVSPSLSYIDIYNNYLKNTENGITVGSEQGGTTENINVYNNIVYNIGSVGISIPQRTPDILPEGIKRNINIYNNTIYRALWNGGAGIYITSPIIENIVIRNNIVYFNNTNGEITAASSALLPFITADHNLVYGSKYCSLNYPNCVEISNNPPGWPLIHDNYTADPKFVSLTNPDFHLQAISPAIDKGVNLRPLVSTDYDGKTRPIGTSFDIGAFEYGSSATPTPTPTSTQTPTPKPGDANGDGLVNEADYSIWLAHYGQRISGGAAVGDFNGDGTVEGIDFSIWTVHYGR